MNLAELIADLPVTVVRGGDVPIRSICEDSRAVTEGALFIARCGGRFDGRSYIADACARGAVAVLCDDPARVPPGPAIVTAIDLPLATALISERFFHHPSQKLQLVAVTGTNGKTTVTHLIHQMLNRAGLRCGLIGTVTVVDGRDQTPAALTTPPAVEISALLRQMVDHGCEAAVVETSSHGLIQSRVAGLDIDIAVFTNLSGDHLDYHHTMEAYADAKAILFESLQGDGCAIVNGDDTSSERMTRNCAAKVVTCSTQHHKANWHATVQTLAASHSEITITHEPVSFTVTLPLIGAYNVANALQAAAVCHRMGLDYEAIEDGLANASPPPGRLQPITQPGDPFTVLVDYAHTDDALDNSLRAVRAVLAPPGKLRVVFGCGGDRDRSKRPRMAAAACRYSDEIIITSDNPRTEDPQAIINDIEGGVPGGRRGQTLTVVDRAEAIELALERAGAGDIVLIAGKGHEDYQIIGETKRSFDDRLIAAAALQALSSTSFGNRGAA